MTILNCTVILVFSDKNCLAYFAKPVKQCVFSIFKIQSGLLFTTLNMLYRRHFSANMSSSYKY